MNFYLYNTVYTEKAMLPQIMARGTRVWQNFATRCSVSRHLIDAGHLQGCVRVLAARGRDSGAYRNAGKRNLAENEERHREKNAVHQIQK